MIIGHLSDLHVVEAEERLFGVFDTHSSAGMAMALLVGLNPRPDVVIVTGDLTGDGTFEQLTAARRLLDGMGLPYYVVPGNHDRRQPFIEVFGEHAAVHDGFVQYVVDDHPVRLVAMDTVNEGHEEGLVCERRLAWLAETLAAAPDRPTLVFLHHPPFTTGVWWMDSAGLAGADQLGAIIGRHPQVGLVACGHVHRPVSASVGLARVALCPSTAFQVHLDLEPEQRPHAVIEPQACLVHTYMGGSFVTHTMYADEHRTPKDLSSSYNDWETVREQWRVRHARLRSPSA